MLRKLGAYDRMRETFAYDCYRYLKEGRPISWRKQELAFYRALLGPSSNDRLIFDIGANRGQRTCVFRALPARVIAVEPDRNCQALLTRRFGPAKARPSVTIVPKAVSDAAGMTTFWEHAPGSGLNSLSRKWVDTLGSDVTRFGRPLAFAVRREVETTTLSDLITDHGLPSYIKVDVEGHEPSVLRGLRQPVPFLSFEVNLPEFVEEGVECMGILDRLDPTAHFNWTRDCRGPWALPEWLPAPRFVEQLRACRERSIEVFWRSAAPPGG